MENSKEQENKLKKEYKKYLVIHGHFYQPPRENPWLEEIEIQKSAYPFHDWNERINNECYKPNAFSKIFGKDGKIVRMVNNYSRMSFNFGPTLLSWLERCDKETYEKILEADKLSIKEFKGHGNAIAQVYNHVIMPLADKKDKDTQIKWGMRDFEKRFGRKSEGLWLAETAIDYDTVDAMIENGVKFTILSPYQAQGIRELGSGEKYIDVLGGKVDATRAYRCFSKKKQNKYIDIFFYDGPISNSIGFEDIVLDSSKYINRLKMAVRSESDHNQIISVATDGETYGHHKKFADLTLAHLLFEAAEKNGMEVTNYALFLAENPPVYEVVLNEGKGQGTAWSCAHGVDRWQDNCGCCSGGNSGWHQKWRRPLRDGLNNLRDKLRKIYEKEAKKYLKDIWGARERYVDVILDRSHESAEKFIKDEANYELEAEEKVILLQLMEMQRNSMLMFTSCGWFFDEISGLETVQILMYAAKAIQCAQDFTNDDLEKELLIYLEKAPSNLENVKNGKVVFENYVKPSGVDFEKIVAHYAITGVYEKSAQDRIYNYEIEKQDYYQVVEGNLMLEIGKVKVKELVSYEVRHIAYGVLRFGNMDFRCSVKNIFSNSEYFEIKKEILSKIESRFSIVEAMRGIDMFIGRDYYTFKDLLLEEKRKVLKKVTREFFDNYKNMYEKIYMESAGIVDALNDSGLHIPQEYKISAEYTLSNKLKELALMFLEYEDGAVYEAQLTALISTSNKWKYTLKKDKIEYKFRKKINEIFEKCEDINEINIERVLSIYKVASILGININTNYSQFKVFNIGIQQISKLEESDKEQFLEMVDKMGFLKETFLN